MFKQKEKNIVFHIDYKKIKVGKYQDENIVVYS